MAGRRSQAGPAWRTWVVQAGPQQQPPLLALALVHLDPPPLVILSLQLPVPGAPRPCSMCSPAASTYDGGCECSRMSGGSGGGMQPNSNDCIWGPSKQGLAGTPDEHI